MKTTLAMAVLLAVGVGSSPLGVRGQTCEVEWQLSERVRIGSMDGADALNEVRSLAVGPDGELYVSQYQVGEVAVFSPDGVPVRTIGRSGQGPGEFETGPGRIGWLDDTLWIADQFRVQSFDREGDPAEFVRFQVSVPSESARYTPGLPLADGSFWGHRWLVPGLGAAPFGQETRTVAFRRFSRSGQILGTIATVDVEGRFVQVSDSPLYEEHPLWAWLPGSFRGEAEQNLTSDRASMVLLGDDTERGASRSMEILRVTLLGDTVARWSLAYEPIRVERTDTDWLRDRFAAYHAGDLSDGSAGGPQMDAAARERRRSFVAGHFWMPDLLPPVREIIAGVDGTVFVLRELRHPARADRWEVYDPHGILLGRFSVSEGRSSTLPWAPRLRILRASRTEVWATTIDELEVPYIHGFAVSDTCGDPTTGREGAPPSPSASVPLTVAVEPPIAPESGSRAVPRR